MVHTSISRTLLIVFLLVIPTVCAVTNDIEREPTLSPNGEIFRKSLVGFKQLIADRFEPSTREEPTRSLAMIAAQSIPYP